MKAISDPLELRIDNLVFDRHGNICSFRSRMFSLYDHPQMGGDYGIYAIPITPASLEACGAHKAGNCNWQYLLKIGALKFYFRFNAGMPYSELGGIYMADHIQYVHQLQNIFYCFTYRELPIDIQLLEKLKPDTI